MVINMIYVLMYNTGRYAGYVLYQSKMSRKICVFVHGYTQSSLVMRGVNIMFLAVLFASQLSTLILPTHNKLCLSKIRVAGL